MKVTSQMGTTPPGPVSLPFVSIIVPCRNEARFIGACLQSIVDNGYPEDRLEVFAVDGHSDDDTPAAVTRLAERYPCVRLLHNARRVTPAALNLGIGVAKGEYVLWMSAHNTYPPGYIAECVTSAIRYGADNVGGIIVTEPRDPGPFAPLIVAALTHRFGVGNSLFRLGGDQAQWVDTVFGGCYRRDVFRRMGLFNEALARGQDIEFNLRLKRAGLRTLLVPSIRSVYHARSRLGDFVRHNWINGMWAVLPFLYVQHAPVRPRHLVPLAFVTAIMGGIVIGLTVPDGWWLLGAIGVSYAAIATVAALDIARRRREWRFVVAMPFVFLALHLSYGAGSLFGVLRLAAALLPRPRGRGTRPEQAP